MAITGNKGEWSEIYALFKLLGEKQVYAGDGNLNKIEDLFYPIIKILREEQQGHYEYSLEDDIVIITEDEAEILRKNVSDFLEKANELLNVIRRSKGAFVAPEVEELMSQIHCSRVKAKSRDKTDITIVIHDLRTGMSPTLGFSIKSQVGSNSTLLNASRATNFCYRIDNSHLSDNEIATINSIETKQKILDRVQYVIKKNGSFKFVGMDDRIFCNNLVLIDSMLPRIVAEVLLNYYSKGENDLKSNASMVAKANPLHYDLNNNHPYYEHKIKNLLVASALGMVPHTPWTGKYDANGGYLVVKEDGDVLCYHFYDRNLFEDYLFENTKLDTPSSSRNKFGFVFKGEDNTLYFKLNLQIRFK